jgi:hypothetical protein
MHRQCVHRYQRRRTRQILWFACNRSRRRGFEAGSKLTPPYHMVEVKSWWALLFGRLLTIGISYDGACCLSMDSDATVSGVNAAACERHCCMCAGTGGSASPIQSWESPSGACCRTARRAIQTAPTWKPCFQTWGYTAALRAQRNDDFDVTRSADSKDRTHHGSNDPENAERVVGSSRLRGLALLEALPRTAYDMCECV